MGAISCAASREGDFNGSTLDRHANGQRGRSFRLLEEDYPVGVVAGKEGRGQQGAGESPCLFLLRTMNNRAKSAPAMMAWLKV